MENTVKEYKGIIGWGVDADPANDPTYSMKERTDEEHKGYTWERPIQQVSDIEVLHSNERPSVSAVFGTSVPPSGLSGQIRRYAFKYSEGSFGHWLPLILADRVNMVEGIVDDLKRGYIPNIFKERGWTAEWKYNRENFVKKVAVGAAVTTLLVTALVLNSKRKSRA